MLDNILSDIKRCNIDSGAMNVFDSEDDFMKLSVDVLVEVGQYICLAACILPGDRKAWSLSEAIVGGNVVRLYKLISAFLDQTCQKRREITVVLGRMVFECIINIKYLIKNASPDLFRSYIHYSLQHEKKLQATILANIESRGGEILDIERRMLASIERSFKASETKPDEIPQKKVRDWGGKNLFEKAKEVGLEDAYLSIISGPSHSVHGNWQELLEYNVEQSEDGFAPCLDWHTPRPQIANAIAIHAVEAAKEYLIYLKYISPRDVEEIIIRLEDLLTRILLLDKHHEMFLVRKQGAS